MATENVAATQPADWRRIHALGLPSGSVRALLAIMIFATTWGLLVFRPYEEVPDYLRDLLFIIMGHYFAVRRHADQGDSPGPPPLYLPSGSIRLLLVAGCVGVAIVLFHQGRLTAPGKNPGVVTLLLVGGFLFGVAIHAVSTWWHGRGHHPPRIFEDVRALVSMMAAALLIVLIWNRLFPFLPAAKVDTLFSRWVHLGRFGPEHALAAVVGFYFGSKS